MSQFMVQNDAAWACAQFLYVHTLIYYEIGIKWNTTSFKWWNKNTHQGD